jgi:hypothetical protein
MHLTPRVFLLGGMHRILLIACNQSVAAGRVRVEPTADLHGEVGRLMYRFDRNVPSCLEHPVPLAAHPKRLA